MDTDKNKALQQVNEAIISIQITLQDESLKDDKRKVIGETEVRLRSIQNNLIISSAQDLIAALSGEGIVLVQLSIEIGKEAAQLDQLAVKIKNIGDVIGSIVTAAT